MLKLREILKNHDEYAWDRHIDRGTQAIEATAKFWVHLVPFVGMKLLNVKDILTQPEQKAKPDSVGVVIRIIESAIKESESASPNTQSGKPTPESSDVITYFANMDEIQFSKFEQAVDYYLTHIKPAKDRIYQPF